MTGQTRDSARSVHEEPGARKPAPVGTCLAGRLAGTIRAMEPYGLWRSPVSAFEAAAASVRLPALARGPSGAVWIEERPAESGRGVIVAQAPDGTAGDLLAPPFSARGKVHEYGGGALHVAGTDIFFVNHADQQVHVLRAGAAPWRLTGETGCRFADMARDPARARLVAVAETHRAGAPPENFLCSVTLDGGAVERLVAGADFYAAPRVSPDGKWLAWLEWNLPFMPWEAAVLKCAPLEAAGRPGAALIIAGGETGAAFQPEWADDGTLLYVCEGAEWSGLHAWRDGRGQPVFTPRAEMLRPLWSLGQASFALLADGRLAALAVASGEQGLWLVAPASGEARALDMPHRALDQIAAAPHGGLYAVAADDTANPAIVEMRLDGDRPAWSVIRRPAPLDLPAAFLSTGEPLAFCGSDGAPVHALYYPPRNPDAVAGGTPPMIVLAHGGPTGAAARGLQLRLQFWTSRGFAVLDVDYRGSTGHGRAYREALQGEWGAADADDVITAARAAAARGLAGPDRLVVSGRSAGGFTALCALSRSDLFRAATVHYGVADLATLIDTTHKFEAGYIYGLTGTHPGDTDKVFAARSPLARAGRIRAPVLFLQGLDDKVVPPQQTRDIAAMLRQNGVPVACLEFPGEGHGFRQAETIRSALAAELAFLVRVLGLACAEPLIDLDIDNWDGP